MNMAQIPQIDHLFPDEWRAFCNGTLAVQVERFGGVNSVMQIDIRNEKGKLFPDREATPWLSRSGGGTLCRPAFMPGLRFMGGRKQYVPVDAELYPFGFVSPAMSMLVLHEAIAFRFIGDENGEFRAVFSKIHMREGKFPSLQNQLAAECASNIRLLPYELRGKDFDPEKPFPDGEMTFEHAEPFFDETRNALYFRATKTYADRKVAAVWAFTCNLKLAFHPIPGGWYLAGTAEKGKTILLGSGFGTTDGEALSRAKNGIADFDGNLEREKSDCAPALKVELEKLPEASHFLEVFPGFQRKLILAETEDEMMVRAASFNYNFFALWDDVYPIRDFLLNGEVKRAQKMIRYMLRYPWVETCPWVTMHLIVTLDEYLAFVDDPAFEKECLPYFAKFFRFMEKFSDPATGFLKTSLNCGVDNSEEVGMTDLFYPVCLNGWWYDALRALENFALDRGDETLRADCAAISAKVEANYEMAFYNEKEGYLRQARTESFAVPRVEVFHYSHTLGMDYNYGRYLFRRILPQLATWQATRLYHPMGHTAVPWDSAIPCEMWKGVHMSQHYGHEGKTARCGGRADEALRLMNGFLGYFKHHKLAIETLNLTGEERDVTMTSRWQGFGATGIAQGILRGACGLDWSRGGFAWLPADEEGKVEIGNFRFRNVVCDISVSGKGKYIDSFTVNGREIRGSLQIPVEFFPAQGRAKIALHRSSVVPGYPVLLQATDLPVGNVKATAGHLSFTAQGTAHASILIQTAKKPEISVNGERQEIEFSAAEELCWLDRIFVKGDQINVEI